MSNRRKWIGLAAVACLLGAGAFWLARPKLAPEPTAADIARAETLTPANPALDAIYQRSCITCHASPDAQAPLSGHAAGWAPRLSERGLDGLVASARNGIGNMPAMGLCPDCSEAEFRALIQFMSTQGEPQ